MSVVRRLGTPAQGWAGSAAERLSRCEGEGEGEGEGWGEGEGSGEGEDSGVAVGPAVSKGVDSQSTPFLPP